MFEKVILFEKNLPNREELLEIISQYSNIPVSSTLDDYSGLFINESELGEESFLIYFKPYPETQAHISINLGTQSIKVTTFYSVELSLYFVTQFALLDNGGKTSKISSKAIIKKYKPPFSIEELNDRHTKKERQHAFQEKYLYITLALTASFYISIIGIGFWAIFKYVFPFIKKLMT